MEALEPFFLTLHQILLDTEFALGRLGIDRTEHLFELVVVLIIRIGEKGINFLQIELGLACIGHGAHTQTSSQLRWYWQ